MEKALGFDLFIWQKMYIKTGEYRKSGMMTAHILKELLDVSAKPIDFIKPSWSSREDFYRTELRHIKQKLDDAGIPTRSVWFSKEDIQRYFEVE